MSAIKSDGRPIQCEVIQAQDTLNNRGFAGCMCRAAVVHGMTVTLGSSQLDGDESGWYFMPMSGVMF